MSAATQMDIEAEKPPSGASVKSPWASLSQNGESSSSTVTSLTDVMSEQLAFEMTKKEERQATHQGTQESLGAAEAAAVTSDSAENRDEECSDDLLIAQMLQMQFDREHDTALSHEERHRNGGSKVSVDYSKYKVIPDYPVWEDEDSDEDEYFTMDDRKRHWDSYESNDPSGKNMPRCGYRKAADGTIVTKHDKEQSQRENGRRIMEMEGIETGDGGGFDMQLSNQVYNKIRNFSIKDSKRKARVHDKADKSTVDQAMDPQTRLLLHKMIDNGVLEGLSGVVATGKESVILHADGGDFDLGNDHPVPKECAIKVFKTTLNEFKTRERYIRDDYRFRDRFSKQNPRKVIHMWAEKELHNLRKMARFGVKVPRAVALKKHVLVMEFIGSDGQPAPKLKDALLSSAEWEIAYEETLQTMRKLYTECHLVHADLSEYNILWHGGGCHFIDVSQSVEPNHPEGLSFLMRDCTNVTQFFRKKGVHDVAEPHELFTKITGLPITEETDIMGQVIEHQLKEDIIHSPPFDDAGGVDDEYDSGTAAVSSARAIPGHPKPKPGSYSKSPKGLSKSPRGGITMSKSPGNSSAGKSPKSPCGSALQSLTDGDLRKLKDTLKETDEIIEGDTSEKKPSVVRFQD